MATANPHTPRKIKVPPIPPQLGLSGKKQVNEALENFKKFETEKAPRVRPIVPVKGAWPESMILKVEYTEKGIDWVMQFGFTLILFGGMLLGFILAKGV